MKQTERTENLGSHVVVRKQATEGWRLTRHGTSDDDWLALLLQGMRSSTEGLCTRMPYLQWSSRGVKYHLRPNHSL